MKIKGKIVDILNRRIYKGEIEVVDGKIVDINETKHNIDHFILPGFIDAHIHIESSMLLPSEFAKIAVKHGTVATVSDPHEIANVLGVEGVDFMIKNGNTVPLKFNFGAPSCVPATSFESTGDEINADAVEELLQRPEIKYLSEMMNYPGVLNRDRKVLRKIEAAKKLNKPVDGHAPNVRGQDITNYINAGISTDHECSSEAEAKEKLDKGMKILIREGSAAKNFEALICLMHDNWANMMFCSDDKHPDDLLLNHINDLCKRAVEKGVDVYKVLQAACINPIDHYNLGVGRLQIGDPADFIVVEDLKKFKTIKTYIDGELVYHDGTVNFDTNPVELINNFDCLPKKVSDFRLELHSDKVKIIEALDGELITTASIGKIKLENGNAISNLEDDILKIAVVNRYRNENPAVAFIKNFGLKHGAIASSVAHDSHNIIAVGTTDDELCNAVNLIIENKGGICTVNQNDKKILKLPVAGIMSDEPAEEVASKYSELDASAKALGSKLSAPFMTLSFMALLVIPDLKLSDKGLFSGAEFSFTNLEEE